MSLVLGHGVDRYCRVYTACVLNSAGSGVMSAVVRAEPYGKAQSPCIYYMDPDICGHNAYDLRIRMCRQRRAVPYGPVRTLNGIMHYPMIEPQVIWERKEKVHANIAKD